AHSVLAGDASTRSDAGGHDGSARFTDLGCQACVAPVETDVWMEIPIAGVKDVADGKAVVATDLTHFVEDVGQSRARNHGILYREIGRDSAHRAKRFLPPLPEPSPVCLRGCASNRAGGMRPQDRFDQLVFRVYLCCRA